jgi:hypothetical protein
MSFRSEDRRYSAESGGVFERKGANRRRLRSAHSAAAVIAALLLILQSLLAVAATPAHAARLGLSIGPTPICALAEPGDPKAPTRDHARPHCCLPGKSCDGSAPPLIVESRASLGRSPVLALASSSRPCAAARRRPAGWASSWSPRAPPTLS